MCLASILQWPSVFTVSHTQPVPAQPGNVGWRKWTKIVVADRLTLKQSGVVMLGVGGGVNL